MELTYYIKFSFCYNFAISTGDLSCIPRPALTDQQSVNLAVRFHGIFRTGFNFFTLILPLNIDIINTEGTLKFGSFPFFNGQIFKRNSPFPLKKNLQTLNQYDIISNPYKIKYILVNYNDSCIDRFNIQTIFKYGSNNQISEITQD